MEYLKEERIGNPELFTGRKKELAFFLKWIDEIKERKSQSTAMLARRKMGKTAILERLFNITFDKNDGVIPFYYEVKKSEMYIVDFCLEFFLTFIYQYIAFKTRKHSYIETFEKGNLEKAKEVALQEGLDYLVPIISGAQFNVQNQNVDLLWETVREAPKDIAANRKEFIVQMVDEFQFLNATIYRDKILSPAGLMKTLTGGYLSTAESKVAPLLVSGSWVGWLMTELNSLLPARFKFIFLRNMSSEEAGEMVFKYSSFFDVPVTEETAYMLAQLAEGSPFYISSIIRSNYQEKNLTTAQGLTATLEYEIFSDEGNIKSTWMDYIASAFNQINQKNAKNIVIYLCQHRDRQITRKELLEKLSLDMTDGELEEKMKALIRADIINKGQSNAEYQGVQDNIFDKVFRGIYEKEIRDFDAKIIGKEIFEAFEKLKKQYHQLLGKMNYQKGYYAEYLILTLLKSRARKINDLLKSVTRYLPADFNFCQYKRIWRYDGSSEFGHEFNVDIFALPKSPDDYAIIGEIKNRELQKFSKEEVLTFMEKYEELKNRENLERVIPFIYSHPGFTAEAETYCQEMGIACTQDDVWLTDEEKKKEDHRLPRFK